MQEFSKTNGGAPPPARWKPPVPLGVGFRWAWACSAAALMLARPGHAQTILRLGPFDLSAEAQSVVAYDSNVDGSYPEEEDPDVQKADFYWMPGLSLRSKPVAMQPRTTLNVGGAVAYQDYFARNDLDTELYNAIVNFQTTLPRLSLGGSASADYSTESTEHIYFPGGMGRSPALTLLADAFGNWQYRKFGAEAAASHSRERYDLPPFQIGDKDESTLSASARQELFTKLNLNASWAQTLTSLIRTGDVRDETVLSAGADLALFSWGGLFYTWERTLTTDVPTDETTSQTISSFGLSGAIPLDLLRHPKITYSLGYGYKEEQNAAGENIRTWEPVHSLTAADEYQISKSIRLTGNANWDSTVTDNEITFVYNVMLEQQLGARARHAVTLTQEPEATFASTTKTKTTTYGYDFSVNDLFIYNLTLAVGATYEESTPLGEKNPETEKSTTLNGGLSHTRLLSRKLSRIIAYDYTRENTNFHEFGPSQKHLVTYTLTYAF